MDDQTLLEAVGQIEDDLVLAETSDALELQIGTDKAAPEASEETLQVYGTNYQSNFKKL